jgi:hypothetical protein
LQTTQDYKKYIGDWKMSSWDGHYQLLGDGSCIINNGPSQPSKGLWFLAFDRLYLVWGMMSDTDVFKLNPDQSMKLQRIDNRSTANVTFEKLVSMNSPSIKETDNNLTKRRKIVVPVKSGGVEEVEPKDFEEIFQGHSYKFIPVKKSWHLAKKDASKSGGYLVVITSPEENQFVNDLIIKANSGQHARTWIGLNNDNEKREWEWVNGEIGKFFDWGPGEPNNPDSECSAHLGFRQENPDWKGKWNNAPSDCMRYYVVEFDNIKN